MLLVPEPLPLDDFPAFEFDREPLARVLGRTVVDLIALLVALGIAIAVGSALILRYDPR